MHRHDSALKVAHDKRVALSWSGLHVAVDVAEGGITLERALLDTLTGVAYPGEIVAVMGASGAGKTLLLNTLATRTRDSMIRGGKIFANRAAIKRENWQHTASYVSQENALYGVLTVRETFTISAQLAGISATKRKAEVEEMAENLGLTTALETKVGNVFLKGISGGQKRRVSMGVELFGRPSVLIMDGITDGLDSAAAFNVMGHVRDLAQAQHTVLLTLNQPSAKVLSLTDKVMLLARGRMVYFGPTSNVVPYFGRLGLHCPKYTNPADWLVGLINEDFEGHADVDALVAAFYQSNEWKQLAQDVANLQGVGTDKLQLPVVPARKTDYIKVGQPVPRPAAGALAPSEEEAEAASTAAADVKVVNVPAAAEVTGPSDAAVDVPRIQGKGRAHASYKSSYLTQFLVLCKRAWLDNLRNPGVFWVRFFMYTMLCFMIGTQFWDLGHDTDSVLQRTAMLYYIAAFLVFMSIAVLPFTLQVHAIFERERGNRHYAVLPYQISNFIMALPGIFMISLVSSLLCYYPAGLHSGFDRFLIFFADLFISLVVAESYVHLVAALVPHYIIGMAVGAGTYGAFMLVEGFFKSESQMKWYYKWLHYLAFHTYTFRVFMVNEFDGLQLDAVNVYNSVTNATVNRAAFPTGESVLQLYDMEDGDIAVDLIVLGVNVVAYQLFLFLVLQFLRTGKH